MHLLLILPPPPPTVWLSARKNCLPTIVVALDQGNVSNVFYNGHYHRM